MKILIITGGFSSERVVSFMSANFVNKTLRDLGFSAKIYDLKYGYPPLKEVSKNFDVLFPVLHGEEGEGGKLHKFLSTLKKPIVGTSNYKGFEDGWYKIPFKKYCDKNGIKTSPWKIVKNKEDIIRFGFPCVLKSSSGGSSKEVVIIRSEKDLTRADCQKLLESDLHLFVEKYVPGVEITVGVFHNKALPVLEIIPPPGKWFDYKNKYRGTTQEIPNPADLDPKITKKVQEIALKIHKNFNLGDYSRTDFIVSGGTPYVLELNTIPGLTENSLFPKMIRASGLTFEEFIEELVNNAH